MRDDIRRREGHDKRCRQKTAARGLRIRTKENDTACAAARKQNARSQPDTIHVKLQCSVRDIINDIKDTIRYNLKYATINDTQYTISYNFYYTTKDATIRKTTVATSPGGVSSPALHATGQPRNDNCKELRLSSVRSESHASLFRGTKEVLTLPGAYR